MKHLAVFVCLTAFVFSARLTPAQSSFHGTIVDVVDGKTAVLEMPNGRMTVVLQYIEVPEKEQPLYQIVIDHFGALVRGRSADFRLIGLARNEVRGQLVIDGVDISQQMLRDGAAWLIPADRSGQSTPDFAAYKTSQDQAKTDGLGVWSISGLKPAWEFRADREEKLRAEQEAIFKARGVRSGLGPYQSNAKPGELNDQKMAAFDTDSWFSFVTERGNEMRGVHSYDDPHGHFRAFYTSNAIVEVAAGTAKQKLDSRAVYGSMSMPDGSHQDIYVLMFMAVSDDYNFSRRADHLTISADGRTIAANLHHGLRGKAIMGALEIWYYWLSRESLKRIAEAGSVQIHIDNLSGTMSRDEQDLIKQLIAGN